MLAPSVMIIEIAVDSYKDLSQWLKDAQQRELTSFGDVRAQQLGATGLSDDFRKGYELGLNTARSVLTLNPTLGIKGIKPEDVL